MLQEFLNSRYQMVVKTVLAPSPGKSAGQPPRGEAAQVRGHHSRHVRHPVEGQECLLCESLTGPWGSKSDNCQVGIYFSMELAHFWMQFVANVLNLVLSNKNLKVDNPRRKCDSLWTHFVEKVLNLGVC